MENEKNLTEEELEFCRRMLGAVHGHCFGMEFEAEYSRELLDVLKQDILELPQDSAALLTLMFRDGKTREEAAAELGVSDPEQIHYLCARGMRMLRHPHLSRRHRPFLIKIEPDQPEESESGEPVSISDVEK